jgi:hypothetical protein
MEIAKMLRVSKAEKIRLDEIKLLAEVRKAWGDWLSEIQWDHVTTLTFSERPSQESAVKQYHRWVQRLRKRAQRDVYWFYSIERGANGALHIHTLTGGTSHIGSNALVGAWSAGWAESHPYDPEQGAAYYVAKDVGGYAIQYDIHVTTSTAAL